jgi:hypothetical protein
MMPAIQITAPRPDGALGSVFADHVIVPAWRSSTVLPKE